MKSLTSVIKDLYRICSFCLSSCCTVLSRLCRAHAQMVALEMSRRFSISHNINNKAHHSKDLFTFLLEEDHVRSLPSMAAQTENGFLHLKQYLKEMSSMRQAVNTGRPLDRLPPLPKKTSPRSTNDKIAADIECTMSIKQHAPAEEEILRAGNIIFYVLYRRIKFRRDEHIIEKLQWIYKILCGLTNMRNRDLKTLLPLASGYVNIIMKDTDKTNVLLKNSQRCLIPFAPEDMNINPDLWESFINHQDQGSKISTDFHGNTGTIIVFNVFCFCFSEPKSPSAKFAGCKPVQLGLRRKAGLKEVENETGDLPPWLNLLLDENTTYEKDPQKPKNRHDMLERVRTKFIEIQRSMNNQMETDMFEKKIHREERMRTLLDALMASRKETSLPMLLSSLKHELREPKSALLFWYEILKSDVSELSDDRDFEYRTILQKIGQFHNFSHKKLPYSKEKFCLLVLSLPSNQLLQPAMQDALMFLTENVFQLLPRQLKHWYQYLKLPFYDAS
ncbi:uncharacterized protein LOC118360755 isoform X3 [Oncorhynchus keta]|uniref:uncharacterized protein LOC118360755 isoform X3 n=1 Tax=Oncorhynchus keta TaxID=8018 RepID=UPI0015F88308|nr:uncharacterized protein LOC118360755 isoform X3 [Oncorhynchus keta]